ncbi:hypothetical protein AHAS_Ahas12G0085200 [Arachis hypogaea]
MAAPPAIPWLSSAYSAFPGPLPKASELVSPDLTLEMRISLEAKVLKLYRPCYRTGIATFKVQPHGAAGYATATTTGDSIQRSGLITLTIVRHVYRKERYSGLRSVGPKTKREQLLKATALVPLLLIFPNAYSMLAANLFVFWHISAGIEEILADYVHHEMTRNYVVIAFKLFLIIAMKDVFLKFVFV